MVDKYVGRIVQIIYLDRRNKLTQRVIEVRAIEGNVVKAYCLKQNALRIFKITNILAVEPMTRKRSG
ncbi:MAG: hypothetical protein JWM44_2450 [Bacilli bacterium]|jgi:predicted DNA-binding transcriptional regulator YafY|nr:hypothetical protein [Bacilli bacterium]